jgi:hypothetical protein
LWARSLAINVVALVACSVLLDNVEIHAVWAYALAAVGIELPTLLWWLAIRFWQARAFSDSVALDFYVGRLAWVAVLLALTFVVPLALATSVPGLLVAEWISPLKIHGFWTYVAASAITAALTVALRQSRPLKYMAGFLRGEAREGTPQPVDTN